MFYVSVPFVPYVCGPRHAFMEPDAAGAAGGSTTAKAIPAVGAAAVQHLPEWARAPEWARVPEREEDGVGERRPGGTAPVSTTHIGTESCMSSGR